MRNLSLHLRILDELYSLVLEKCYNRKPIFVVNVTEFDASYFEGYNI
jgi:hypothetical protein